MNTRRLVKHCWKPSTAACRPVRRSFYPTDSSLHRSAQSRVRVACQARVPQLVNGCRWPLAGCCIPCTAAATSTFCPSQVGRPKCKHHLVHRRNLLRWTCTVPPPSPALSAQTKTTVWNDILPILAGVVLPRTPDTASAGGVLEAALQDVSQVSAPGDESPTGQPPLYAPNVAAGPFAWDPEAEERFARFVTVRISVRCPAAAVTHARCWSFLTRNSDANEQAC